MTPLQAPVPLDALARAIPYVVLVLVLANLLTRHRAHRSHRRAAERDEEISHHTLHVAVSLLLVLVSFLFLVVEPHGGMVMTVLVVGMVVSDFFEFEARLVEARNDMPIERPKAAIVASFVVLLYALFQSLFWVIKEPWSSVI